MGVNWEEFGFLSEGGLGRIFGGCLGRFGGLGFGYVVVRMLEGEVLGNQMGAAYVKIGRMKDL